MGKVEREIEKRTKHLDVFTDEFNPPYSREIAPGQDTSKRRGGYQKPHDDKQEPDLKNPIRLGYAGKASDQESLDALDRQVQQYEAQIKLPKEQFPGGKMSELKSEIKNDFGVETKQARLTRLAKIDWGRPDDRGCVFGEAQTKYGLGYKVEIHEDPSRDEFKWIVSKNGQVLQVSNASTAAAAKSAIVKFMKSLEDKGM